MKKGVVAGLLTMACFNGYTEELNNETKAPFGLKWKQSFEDVNKNEDIDLRNCKSMREYKACDIDLYFSNDKAPFTPWTMNAILLFKDNELISVTNGYHVSESKKSDCGSIPEEIKYLSSLGVDTTQLTELTKLCATFENKGIKKTIKTHYGTVEFVVMKVPFGEVIGITTYKLDNQ
ncbi:hypothetical protein [Providencia sp. PROV152]|uniref:Uncharacterized protein n=1 Tax=Providencia stuartii TaxID=588 RepID=A0AAI9HVX2_PROST|nr:hypothetical protein [Providencia sp. PROV152]ELR5033947.1 hypothetical protein [Providencia stuartii]